MLADVHRGEGEECTASLRPYNRAQAADLYALLENERSETPLPPPASMAPDEHDAEGDDSWANAEHGELDEPTITTVNPGGGFFTDFPPAFPGEDPDADTASDRQARELLGAISEPPPPVDSLDLFSMELPAEDTGNREQGLVLSAEDLSALVAIPDIPTMPLDDEPPRRRRGTAGDSQAPGARASRPPPRHDSTTPARPSRTPRRPSRPPPPDPAPATKQKSDSDTAPRKATAARGSLPPVLGDAVDDADPSITVVLDRAVPSPAADRPGAQSAAGPLPARPLGAGRVPQDLVAGITQEDKPERKKKSTKSPRSKPRVAKGSTTDKAMVAKAPLALPADLETESSLTGRNPLIGRAIGQGKYIMEALIGSGAAGAVYRAQHRDLRRTVAIKVLHPHYQNDLAFMKRFHGEALAASRLDHPNIMRVIDFGQESDGLVYIVMEFLSGKPLQTVLDEEGRLDRGRAVDILQQVCAGLICAHEAGIVHRDIKPDNIVLVPGRDDEGKTIEIVKVCDFGIAALQNVRGEDNEYQLSSSVICGTPEYMSPEQGRGQSVDARTDVYACGIMLYELLTGRPPFLAENPIETLLKHAREAPVPPSQLVADLDPSLEEVVLKAIRKNPDERQQSARELRLELRELSEPEADESTGQGVANARPLSDPDAGFRVFFVAFASATLEMGQFQREHPGVSQATKHLRQVTQQVLRGRGEITFARRDTQAGLGYIALGRRGDPQTLSDLLGAQLEEVYTHPFAHALANRAIAAITIREGLPDADLAQLIEILRTVPRAASTVPKRVEEKNLRGASVLFNTDVLGRERKLSFRVGLAMSRLVRDLKLLSAARGLSLRKVREHRRKLFVEAAMTVSKAEDFRQLLLNADMVDQHAPSPQGGGATLLREIVIETLPEGRAAGLLQLLIADLDHAQRDERRVAVLTPLLRALSTPLLHERSADGDLLLQELLRRNILSDRELPKDLANIARTEHLADTLARDPAMVLAALENITDEHRYAVEMLRVEAAAKSLAKRGEAHALLTVIAALARYAKGKGGQRRGPREAEATRVLMTIIERDRLVPLANVLLRGHPDLREPARQILVLAGGAGAQALFLAREQLRDPSGRAAFVVAMKESGTAAWPVISQVLQRMDPSREDFDVALSEDLLLTVPERLDPTLSESLLRFVMHGRLRAVAAAAYGRASGDAGKPKLIEWLEHPDETMRLASLAELRRRRVDEPVLVVLERALSQRTASDEYRTQAALALSDAAAPARTRAIQFLVRGVEARRGLIATLRGDGPQEESREVLVAMAKSLLALDRKEGARVVRARASKSDAELARRLSELLQEA